MPVGRLAHESTGLRLVDGFMLRWYEALGQALGLPLEQVVRSRRRLDASLLSGEADVLCLLHPEWVPSAERRRMRWAQEPFLQVIEQIVAGPGVPLPRTLEDLQGERIGTVLGFSYPQLQPLFADGRLIRDDAPNEESLAAKLLKGHSRYAVLEQAQLNHLSHASMQGAQLRPTGLGVQPFEAFCALSPKGRVSLDAFNAAQSRLLQNAQLRARLQGH